ncbi:MAG TPA: aminodeoxychorismate synthase component I, partial [Jatrophihabitantaceae bacterium]
ADFAPRRHADEGTLRAAEGQSRDVVGGGWFGYLAYSGASWLGFYDRVLRWRDGRWWYESLADHPPGDLAAAVAVAAPADVRPQWMVGEFTGAPEEDHLAAVEQAIELIRAGELYQVNVCTRLAAPFGGLPAALWADAAARLRPVHGAFVSGDRVVASLSPELFLRRQGDLVTTSPIKGTALSAQALARSAKDAAENVMIVDLMRNDLGRVARTGTVQVAELLSVEPHPGVWHLVSTVTARVDADDAELLAAMFPPGSVTGAPKVRATQAIASLEPTPRGVYTGAIGFASPAWGLEFNVAIRTFEIADDVIELGVGGGITADSVPMLEWRECLHKAAPLLGALDAKGPFTPDGAPVDRAPADAEPADWQLAGGLLETILAVDGEPVRLADHLARLDRSCRELYGSGLPDDLAARIRDACTLPGRAVVRVRAPEIEVSVAPAGPLPGPSHARIVRGRRGLWRHKWADRAELAAAESTVLAERTAIRGSDDQNRVPLFVADDGAVLETSRGNVFLLLDDGTLITPPLRDDLLPGITRRALLDRARDRGRSTRLATFTLDELLGAAAAFWTSSLSGVVPIASVDGVPLPRRDAELATLLGPGGGRRQER